MAADVLVHAVAHAGRPGLDRPALQVALQVAGQRLGRGVALRGILLQGLFQQHVEVTAQLPGLPLQRAPRGAGLVGQPQQQ